MSHEHKDALALIELPTVQKAVLWQLADCACSRCGLAWPGVPWISRYAGTSERGTRTALHWLVENGFLAVHWQATGGRGRSTEFIVTLAGVELDPAPCPRCLTNLKPHPNGRHG